MNGRIGRICVLRLSFDLDPACPVLDIHALFATSMIDLSETHGGVAIRREMLIQGDGRWPTFPPIRDVESALLCVFLIES